MKTRLLVLAAALAGAVGAHAEPIVALGSGNTLRSFDSATPATISAPIAVTGLQSGETLLGIDFRPQTGQLYGLGSTSRLYVINTTTGAATQVGSAGTFTLSGSSFGFDFNPTVDRIRVVSNTGQNLRLNPNDGTLSATDTPLAFASGTGVPSVVGAAYTNNFAGATTTTLYDLDSGVDSLFTQSPPNNGTLNLVGSVGVGFGDLAGFDISGASGTAFASFASAAAALTSLYTVNLATGAGTLLGSIGNGLTISDISVVLTPVPEPETYALFGLGLAVLGALRRARARRS
jgi:hypothetical protein